MSERKERCETCRFYHHGLTIKDGKWAMTTEEYPDGMTLAQVEYDEGDTIGECRRLSPVMVDDEGKWPPVWLADFCGEWQATPLTGG